jgi:NAD(P)H-dependent FMN reductase
MKVSIVTLSASEFSVGRCCLPMLEEEFRSLGHDLHIIDIRSLPPVWVNAQGLSGLPPEFAEVASTMKDSDAIVLIYGVYNYTMSSPAKAFEELYGDFFKEMPVGAILAAGSHRSHLAAGDLMLSLMFEYDTFCFPRHVMATGKDLRDGAPGPELAQRIKAFAADFARFAAALGHYRNPAPPQPTGPDGGVGMNPKLTNDRIGVEVLL